MSLLFFCFLVTIRMYTLDICVLVCPTPLCLPGRPSGFPFGLVWKRKKCVLSSSEQGSCLSKHNQTASILMCFVFFHPFPAAFETPRIYIYIYFFFAVHLSIIKNEIHHISYLYLVFSVVICSSFFCRRQFFFLQTWYRIIPGHQIINQTNRREVRGSCGIKRRGYRSSQTRFPSDTYREP